ncbi:hypothetical protein ACEWY4_018974 [Coilia grayii]|uniref:Alpha-carbonic anhydrase domain-containing protein n=1 Tax=Coilia grayii TaxID=363190 RepID=A0ABD1JEP9_9TELE
MVDTAVDKKVLSVILVTLMFTKVSPIGVSTRDFCYTERWCEPGVWFKTFLYCINAVQLYPSPVNVNPDYLVRNMSMTPLMLVNFDTLQPGPWILKNIRNTVALNFGPGMQVMGGNFPKVYETLYALFRWGSAVSNGSEHTYNNRRYPMEMQIFHVVHPYPDVLIALYSEAKSVAALSIFIDVSVTHCLDLLCMCVVGNQVAVSPVVLRNLLPEDISKFYRYEGAMTFPDCLPIVSWLIFEEPIYISQKQYKRFFSEVYYHEPDEEPPKLLVKNFRPVTTLGFRILEVSPNATIPPKDSVSGLSANVLAVLSACLVSLLMKWMSY